MRLKFVLLFTFYTLLFLFYPGDTYYFHIFAYNRSLFDQEKKNIDLRTYPIPYVKTYIEPPISAEGVYIIDLPTFTPVYKRQERQKFLPASTNKIITALVANDIYKPEQVITVKKIMGDGQTMGLAINERITVENLLYGMLVHSGNDAAYVLAENYGYDKFITLMNNKAQELGMKESQFTNPAGLDDFIQVTTPFDLALAARALLNHPYLSKIVSTKEIVISDIDFQIFHKLTNVNSLLGEVQGIGGLKTGYTENAGENLVSFYKKNGHQFVIVILKSQDRFADTKELVKWIDANIGYIN